jgi:site-specific DNA recombinase
LVITSGRSRRGHRRYGCSQHFYRGTCSNGIQIRKDLLEHQLLAGLQNAVLESKVLAYAIEEFCRQLKDATGNLSRDTDRAISRKRQLETEVSRLVAAIADGGNSASVMAAIDQKEQELHALAQQLGAAHNHVLAVEPDDVAGFVTRRLLDLPGLLNSDVTQARAELLRHVTEIRMIPHGTNKCGSYVAEGDWNLLGGYLETERARHLLGVRARLVAGVGFEPTTSGL